MSATSDRNKGLVEFVEAITRFSRTWSGNEVLAVLFGASEPSQPPKFGIPVRYMGRLFDDVSLSLLYSAADVFVAPSLQENLPTTVMEAMACGTATAAFDCAGFPDLVQHRRTGYLAKAFDPADLARGIEWILSDPPRSAKLGAEARKHVEERFEIANVTRQYLSLYQELVEV
jgi:glycosyltransferase involved in cell wall biosynthesis